MSHTRNRRSQRGFTLIEVLLVLVILVVLASFAVVQFRGIQQRAKLDTAKAQVGLCETAMDMYQLSIGNYPNQAQGLAALRACPQDLPDRSKWDGPYLKRDLPLDPWGNPYQYANPGAHNGPDGYDVWSLGPDGSPGTPDDIGNWNQEVAR
jgi:general secretion pathway protein G